MPASAVLADATEVEIWAPQVADLAVALRQLAFVAGGAARQIVMRNDAPPAEDIDLFLYTDEDFRAACLEVENLGYYRAAESAFSTTFGPRDLIHELPVQVIKPFRDTWSLTYGAPEDVITQFSFTTEMFALDRGRAVVGVSAQEDTLARRLVLQNITNPLWVALRATKYTAKGYSVSAADMRRILDAWMDRPQQRRAHRG